MKKLVKASLFFFFLSLPSHAHAGKVMFGDQDSIHFVANTTIAAPGGGHLYLGHLVTMHAFLLPYYVESKGLVFGISGESKKYIPLPTGGQLTELQNAGLLPNELPKTELSLFDYLFGFSLELFVLGMIGYGFFKKKFSK
ncbi:MAG: hypothetical protein LWW87_12360 [Geobacteraceae bacterium]|nr:hypothetical protein [Geobacteraceae bacterium]